MGKAQRIRETRARRREEYVQLRERAAKAAARAKGFALASVILTAISVAFQAILQSVMHTNLKNGVYEASRTDPAEIAALRSILPVGAIGLALLTVGTVLVWLFVARRRPRLSLIGCGFAAIGVGFFVPYVITLGRLFKFDALAGLNGRGLDFRALFTQHYAALLPLLLLIPAVWLCFYAVRKEEVAEIMQSVNEDASTLLLDEE